MRIVAIGRNPSRKPHIEPHPSRTTKGIGDMQPAPTQNPAPRRHKAHKIDSGDVGLSRFRPSRAKRSVKEGNPDRRRRLTVCHDVDDWSGPCGYNVVTLSPTVALPI